MTGRGRDDRADGWETRYGKEKEGGAATAPKNKKYAGVVNDGYEAPTAAGWGRG